MQEHLPHGRNIHRWGVALCLAAACATGGAATLKAGRASTELPDDPAWKIHSVPVPSIGISAGVHGRSEMSSTVAWRESVPGRADAVFEVEGSKDSYNSALVWGASCEEYSPSSSLFVRNGWRNLLREAHDDCLLVGGPFDLGASLSPATAELMRSKGVQVDVPGYIVRSTISRQGTTLTVWAYLPETFRGSTNPLSVERGPAEVPAAIVQWGVELAAAVRESTLSLSGRFKLPPMRFDKD
jgi:hypothetical protein